MRQLSIVALFLCFAIAAEDQKPSEDPKPEPVIVGGGSTLITGQAGSSTLIWEQPIPAQPIPAVDPELLERAKARLAELKNAPPAQQKGRESAYRLRVFCVDDSSLHALLESPPDVGTGTCVAVEKHKLLTAFHCVRNATRILIDYSSDDKGQSVWVRCTVDKVDEDLDLALINCDADLVPVEIDNRRETDLGEIATHWGCPHSQPVQAFTGVVLKNARINDICREFDASVTYGCSGGPIISKDGKLIGIVQDMFEKAGNTAIFMPARRIKQFLAEPKEEK